MSNGSGRGVLATTRVVERATGRTTAWAEWNAWLPTLSTKIGAARAPTDVTLPLSCIGLSPLQGELQPDEFAEVFALTFGLQ